MPTMAYVSNESGQNEVYVRPFPGGREVVGRGAASPLLDVAAAPSAASRDQRVRKPGSE